MSSNYDLIQPKIFQAQKEKKPVFNRLMIIFCLFVLVAVGLSYLVFFSSIFKIKSIEILGTAPSQVEEKLINFKGKNIFLVDVTSAEQDLIKEHSEYFSVKIYRGIPDALKVKFKERSGELVWQSDGSNYLVDKEGVIFKETESLTNFPIVKDNSDIPVQTPSHIVTSGFVEFVKLAHSKLKDSEDDGFYFEVNDTIFQVTAVKETAKIIFDTARPLSDQYDAYRLVYDKNKDSIKEYIDVRVEGRVYYK